jgi:hypothetical protein
MADPEDFDPREYPEYCDEPPINDPCAWDVVVHDADTLPLFEPELPSTYEPDAE